jgi:hypothetical protein
MSWSYSNGRGNYVYDCRFVNLYTGDKTTSPKEAEYGCTPSRGSNGLIPSANCCYGAGGRYTSKPRIGCEWSQNVSRRLDILASIRGSFPRHSQSTHPIPSTVATSTVRRARFEDTTRSKTAEKQWRQRGFVASSSEGPVIHSDTWDRIRGPRIASRSSFISRVVEYCTAGWETSRSAPIYQVMIAQNKLGEALSKLMNYRNRELR